MSVTAPNVSLTPASQFVGDQVSWFRPPKLRSAVTWTAGNTLGLGDSMKRFLLVLPFLLAACDSGVTAPAGVTLRPVIKSGTEGTCTLANGNTAATGFDQYGYNRCAHQFVGTYGSWCEARGQDEDCGGVKGSTKLVMKWNEEWDRGNAENWANPPYAAWENNEARGFYLDGTPFSEHFKTRWDAGCVSSDGASSTNGGDCIWGQFEILMDHGMEDGVHTWWTKLNPAGYGNSVVK